MKTCFLIIMVVLTVAPGFAQSKYGLNCVGDSCPAVDQKAEQRMVAAKSICESANSTVTFRKDSKPPATEMQSHWNNINSAALVAERGYTAYYDCGHADLIVKIDIDTMYDRVSLEVTDAESGEDVFDETRDIHDEKSDLIRMAQQFDRATKGARAAVEEARREQEQAAIEQQRLAAAQAAAKKEQEATRQCQTEYDNIKQEISRGQDVQKQALDHNARCSNVIDVAAIREQQKADATARLEQEFKKKRDADLAKEKSDAFAAYTHIIAGAPFVPPSEGWAHEANLVGTNGWYIVLPRTGFTNDCRFERDGQHPVLDCLSAVGRNDYVPIVDNGRWYLLKSRTLKKTGELATNVKNSGSTLCLRQSGCYRVLAEVRQVPTSLPDKFQVPDPSTRLTSYTSDDVDFRYPQNWKVEEKKNNEGVVVQWNVAPPEAHLGNWVTHGFFLTHVLKMSSDYPRTLDGAYDQYTAYERQRELTIAEPKAWTIGDLRAKLATYTSPSVLAAGESGWVATVKDKTEGYYCIEMFYPSNDDAHLYGQTFDTILNTLKLKK